MSEKDKRDYYICLAIFVISVVLTIIIPNSGVQVFFFIVDLFLFNVLLPFTVTMIQDRKYYKKNAKLDKNSPNNIPSNSIKLNEKQSNVTKSNVKDNKEKNINKKNDEKTVNALFETAIQNQGQRDFLFNWQRPNDDDYGYSLENPIMESTIPSSYEYLERLRTLDGKKLTYNRVGALGINIYYDENTIVDKYELFLDGKQYKTIFICPYGHSGNFAPKGLKLVDKAKK